MRKNHFAFAMLGISIGIAAGAMGAHSLEKLLSVRYLSVWETAWKYWIYNMLGLMALVSFISKNEKNDHLEVKFYRRAGIIQFIWIGSVIFTGTLVLVSLNELVDTNWKLFGAITPLGGTLLIGAWGWGAVQLFKHHNHF